MPHTPVHIVVVDDDRETAAMLMAFFAMLDLAVAPCPGGPDAPACITQYRPQLIILDMQLAGGLTGVEVLHQLRQDPALRAVPVIFFSGDEHQVRQRLPDYHTQGVHFVEKPDIDQLSALVQCLVPSPPA